MRMDQRSSGPLLAAIFGIAAGGCSDTDDNNSGEPTTGSSVAPGGSDSSGSDTSNIPSSTAPAPGVGQPSATNGGTAPPTTAGSVDDGVGTTPPASSGDTGAEPSTGMGQSSSPPPTSTLEPPVDDDTAVPGDAVDPGDTAAPDDNDTASQGENENTDGPGVNDTSDGTQGESEVPETPGEGETPGEETPGETNMPGDATFGPDVQGSCTASQPANSNASGTGPYEVIVETNSDPGINEGTIFRPAQLGGDELFPIFVWGQGGCSLNGLSNAASMAEIASHGYFVVADGSPNGDGSRMMNTNDVVSMGEPLLAYIDWALTENAKPCSAYYHALDATKIAANGFSCGGLMSTGTAGDPRITTWGSTSSGTFSANQALYQSVHTPVLIIEGGPSDIAYENGLRDYENISPLGHPIMFFSKDIGHGGDLFQGNGGDFTKINLAWLNWWLKGDESVSGKGLLVGAGCSYCTNNEWEVMSANVP